MKKIDLEKISYDTAPYALVEGIDTSYILIDARKQLNDTIMTANIFSVHQNKALNALIKLQSFGVTKEEILNIYEFLKGLRLIMGQSSAR